MTWRDAWIAALASSVGTIISWRVPDSWVFIVGFASGSLYGLLCERKVAR